ncbi:MAG: FAD-dependent oxidoreductase [Deferribacterota bacterium]|nr:FAD-dependent oxidoreductase [Deferribacterota bacterium]
MESIDHESVIAAQSLKNAPISLTTTEVNLTGSWKIFKPYISPGIAQCITYCPLNIDIPRYNYFLKKGDKKKALTVLREYNPIPAILGRVCPGFCRSGCNRLDIDEALNVSIIEKYLGDYGIGVPYKGSNKLYKHSIAIIGSGPAGIGAAYFLKRNGLNVTIYEKENKPGGLLRYGIPPYRLPRDILDKELDNLFNSLNIEIVCNQYIDNSDIDNLLKEHDFIFYSPGLNESVTLKHLEDIPNVIDGLTILKDLNCGIIPKGKVYAIIGGGNVAVDIARSLVRLNKKVVVLYRRTYKEMPAYEDEKKQMLEEGVELREKTLVGDAIYNDDKLDLDIRKAVNIDGKIVEGKLVDKLSVDYLILAVGQKKSQELDRETNIFLGGDYLLGPTSVAESIASSRKASESIIKQLIHKEDQDNIQTNFNKKIIDSKNINKDFIKRSYSVKASIKRTEERIKSFSPVIQDLGKDKIEKEVKRCINCGICNECSLCWFFCPDNAISIAKNKDADYSVVISLEYCKGCGICAKVCPRGIIEMTNI